jgi:hypothetical protein
LKLANRSQRNLKRVSNTSQLFSISSLAPVTIQSTGDKRETFLSMISKSLSPTQRTLSNILISHMKISILELLNQFHPMIIQKSLLLEPKKKLFQKSLKLLKSLKSLKNQL